MFGLVPSRRGGNISRRQDIWDMRSFIDSFFNDPFFTGFPFSAHPIRADIRENDKEYIIEAELPGVRKEDIRLELNDDVLTISVENRTEVNEEREDYIRRERRYGSFSRSFYLDNVKSEDVKASYENGILTITLPKLEQAKRKGRFIDIN